MLRSFRFSARNVALFYAIASLFIIVMFATPIWVIWHISIDTARNEILEDDAQRLTDIFVSQGPDALAAAIETRVGGRQVSARRIFYFADPAMNKRAGNLPAWPPQVTGSTQVHNIAINMYGRKVQVDLLAKTLPGGYHLIVALDIGRYEEIERLFLYGLLCAGAAAFVVALLSGLLMRRALLSRVNVINSATTAIVEEDLSRRLSTHHEGDELDMLTHTVNRMLDQIELLVQSTRNTSNAIAHDLRTPLAELRSRLEELSVTRPSANEIFSEIEAAIADIDGVMAIFNALLRLAEIDNGTRHSGFVDVDVIKVASEVAEFYQPVAELKEITLSFVSSGSLRTTADPLLLAQAIGNLIDNALKYAQQNGIISVEAKQRADQIIEVIVADDGPGIPDEEKLKVIERFYRSDATRSTPGVGLGLSLVAAVARLHRGALELSDNHPGLRATLILGSSDTSALGTSSKYDQPN